MVSTKKITEEEERVRLRGKELRKTRLDEVARAVCILPKLADLSAPVAEL